MKFNVISNLHNGAGLEVDCNLVIGMLRAAGHEPNAVQHDAPHMARRADKNLFIELFAPELMAMAREQILIPNPEWWFEGWNRWLPVFARILCKTRHAQEHFHRLAGFRAVYLGFESQDLLDESVPRRRQFIHVAGASSAKNTDAVLDCWRKAPPPAKLIVISRNHAHTSQPIPNVEFHTRLEFDRLKRLMNESLFHLMPSAYEGFGHAVHEAEGLGAVIITMNRPPMTEVAHHAALAVEPTAYSRHQGMMMNWTGWREIELAVSRALSLTTEEIEAVRAATRAHFLAEREAFRQRFAKFLEGKL